MMIRNILLITAVGVFALWGYERFIKSPSPSEVYVSAVESARAGDEEEFLSHFTKDSRSRIQGLLAISRNQVQRELSSYRHLSPFAVSREEVDDDFATLTLERGRDSVFLRREDGRWKIDLFRIESTQ